ncbi:methyltransferase domain-containing protein [Burkholderia dolosa]|uniref:methyltransferase domain-containing protein n=1 Tax=Burkholderia dolosa TaxID=152500 RepID=UPI001BA331B0|nr:methyltransferase domain-containing protein [Burkholderia dolosa]MBR8299988.1 methyltransferase domain-containing protein [Burkholderia dolosa]MDN7447438.1 methyltransferase domain-containing protein [Burkholderia multivorans]
MESLRIDLGCGPDKSPGLIGVDRLPMPGVDVIADLNAPLPFEDDSVELIVASHSLEHVNDLVATMRELYRICKHGAQLCIVAPYHEQKLNVANPYHIVTFNEHTARFFTNARHSGANAEQYWHPHATDWGLAESDHSSPGVDFRLAKMEFFYFPAFLGLSEEDRLQARRHLWDVCDQMLCQLVVWKRPGATDEEVQKAIERMTFFEPAYVTARREADAALALERKGRAPFFWGGEGRTPISRVDDALTRIERAEAQLSELQYAAMRGDAAHRSTASELAILHQKLETLGQQAAHTRSLVENEHVALDKVREELGLSQQALQSERSQNRMLRDALTQHTATVDKIKSTLELQSTYLRQAWSDAVSLSIENDLYRNRKLVRLASLIRSRENLKANLPEPFGNLLAVVSPRARVVLGQDLRNRTFAAYREMVPVNRPRELEIAIYLPVKNLGDAVGVELVSPSRGIIFHEMRLLDHTWKHGPVHFSLTDVRLSQGEAIEVRLFTRDSTSPIYPMEVCNRRWTRRRRPLMRWY